MAELVTIDAEQYKKRSPWGVWGLSIITIGIYYFVWYYKINDEARRFLRDSTIKPGISVLAITLGAFVLIPPYVSIYRTAERTGRIQDRAAIESRISPLLALIASLFFALHIPYVQDQLNKAWDRLAGQASARPAPLIEGGTPTPPPPPPPQP